MKDYRSQFDALRFSPEEKQAMIDDLLATAPETHRRVSHKKRVHVLIAAVIAAALCAACASGALQAAIQSLSFFLGNQPEQTQVLGEMAQPIGASVSDNGVTLTVDAVLGDANSYAILYTLSRDDGTPLLQNVDPDANLYNTHFDEGWTITDPDSIELQEGEGLTFTGNNLLYTAFRPTDNAIHFFEEWHCPTLENMSGPARAIFKNFRAGIVSMDVEKLRISPLSLCVTYAYEIDEEKVAAAYDPAMTTEPKEEWVSNEIECQTIQTHVFLHLKDGATKEVGSYGDMYSKKGKQILSGTFSEITPLDTIESISIGDLTIPMPQS